MATPESWENATPIYGIRYPKPTAPAYKLPDSFQHTGLDVESALQAASVPPVISSAIMVAATAAARDAFWGVPATDADRMTLQNRGATTIRTDTGWSERYFAAGSASNVGGAAVPGWYPVSGKMPHVYANTPGGTSQSTPAAIPLSPRPDLTPGMWVASDPTTVTLIYAGLWRVSALLNQSGIAAVTARIMVDGALTVPAVQDAQVGAAGAAATPGFSLLTPTAAAGSKLVFQAFSPAPVAYLTNSQFTIEFVQPMW